MVLASSSFWTEWTFPSKILRSPPLHPYQPQKSQVIAPVPGNGAAVWTWSLLCSELKGRSFKKLTFPCEPYQLREERLSGRCGDGVVWAWCQSHMLGFMMAELDVFVDLELLFT